MWICRAYGREFVANTEDACWDLLLEFERSVTLEDFDEAAQPELFSGEF